MQGVTDQGRESFLEELAGDAKVALSRDKLASRLTTLAIGGPLKYLFEPHSIEELSALVSALKQNQLSYMLLGAGSNALIPDEGVGEVVIRLGRGLRFLEALGEESFKVGANTSVMWLSRELSEQGYAGLEFAGGIPASLGGAVKMNAGAHGGEFSSVIHEVHCVDDEGNESTLGVDELQYSYRHSALPKGWIVAAATLKLSKDDPEAVRERRLENLEYRKRTQPLQLPSAGSVFRNPTDAPAAGKLLEDLGLKGHTHGGAMISELHGNWIVNPKREARYGDVLALIELCQERVAKAHGIELIPEVLVW